jgi:hypothetical protein
MEATGARFLLEAGTTVRIEGARLQRTSGPLPRRAFDLPLRDPETRTPSPDR